MTITNVIGKLPPARMAVAETKAVAKIHGYYDLRLLLEALEDDHSESQAAVYVVLRMGYAYYSGGRLYRRDIRPRFIVDAVQWSVRRGYRYFDDALAAARALDCPHAARAIGRVVGMGYGDIRAIMVWRDLFA